MNSDLHVALFRGINVGRAKRVAMADLRKLLADLGYRDVRTVLNSGNAVFGAPACQPVEAAVRIEEALVLKLGVAARVTVLGGAQFAQIIDDNSLLARADDPSRLLVAVLHNPADLEGLAPLLKQDWSPEAFAAGRRAAYLWCPAGVLASRAAAALGVLLGDAVTSRNWATMLRLHALLTLPQSGA